MNDCFLWKFYVFWSAKQMLDLCGQLKVNLGNLLRIQSLPIQYFIVFFKNLNVPGNYCRVVSDVGRNSTSG